MAEKLDSIINIDGDDYQVVAAALDHKLIIKIGKNGDVLEKVFDGSSDSTIEIPDVSEYVTDTELAAKGYLTEHQPLKTINGESITGTGNITISGGSGGNGEFAENANKIQVTMNDNIKEYATVTASTEEPTAGKIGDIWFKY